MSNNSMRMVLTEDGHLPAWIPRSPNRKWCWGWAIQWLHSDPQRQVPLLHVLSFLDYFLPWVGLQLPVILGSDIVTRPFHVPILWRRELGPPRYPPRYPQVPPGRVPGPPRYPPVGIPRSPTVSPGYSPTVSPGRVPGLLPLSPGLLAAMAPNCSAGRDGKGRGV